MLPKTLHVQVRESKFTKTENRPNAQAHEGLFIGASGIFHWENRVPSPGPSPPLKVLPPETAIWNPLCPLGVANLEH